METIGDARSFLSAAREVALGKLARRTGFRLGRPPDDPTIVEAVLQV